jgi:hypothetical protein
MASDLSQIVPTAFAICLQQHQDFEPKDITCVLVKIEASLAWGWAHGKAMLPG